MYLADLKIGHYEGLRTIRDRADSTQIGRRKSAPTVAKD